MQQFEWYVPVDATTHMYLQALGRVTGSPAEADAFRTEVDEKWVRLALDGFNNDDVWAREATEEFYGDRDRGWVEERLFETDIAIVQWRQLASRYNRGIQQPENL
jgi:carbazole 1,9a-dioxygenase terminal dioxygenase component